MGADIHPHIEYRYSSEEHWYCFADPDLGRDYNLFGLLAGVRGGPPLYQPRGPVKDPSFCSKDDIEDRNNHSYSWLTLEELKEVQDEYIAQFEMPNPFLGGVIGAMEYLEYYIEGETRLVFSFDS